MENHERFIKNYEDYKEISKNLEEREVTVHDYKSVACGVGTYPQRDDKHMLRLRIPGGRITKEQMKTVLDISEKYSVKVLKFSTGQSIQLHDLTTETIRQAMPEFWENNITTMGAGGNHPANVMASPRSGVDPEEHFDVMPYAEAASRFLVDSIGVLKLPRKFKVGFDASDNNDTHATFKDLGFSACADGTFEVYAAGGLGINPLLGIKIAEKVQPQEILYYLKAMMLVFAEKGNYLNWKKARTRYMQETVGVDVLKSLILERVEELRQDESLMLPKFAEYEVNKSGDGEIEESTRIRAQKQEGLYSVLFHSIGGFVPLDRLRAFYEVTAEMPEVEYRISVDGGIYVLNCTAVEAQKILFETPEGARTEFETSISCVGRSRCDIGACNSQKLLEDCMVEVMAAGFEDGIVPRIAVSGCISSCSAHQAAPMGFRGIMKRTEDGLSPAFFVFWGGNDRKGQEVLAESTTIMLADDIPNFLVTLGKTVAASEEKNYQKWIRRHPDKMEALIARYAYTSK